MSGQLVFDAQSGRFPCSLRVQPVFAFFRRTSGVKIVAGDLCHDGFHQAAGGNEHGSPAVEGSSYYAQRISGLKAGAEVLDTTSTR
jgi:hypothetical protein